MGFECEEVLHCSVWGIGVEGREFVSHPTLLCKRTSSMGFECEEVLHCSRREGICLTSYTLCKRTSSMGFDSEEVLHCVLGSWEEERR